MKMFEAAESVLRDLGRTATTREIYEEIVKRDLFQFAAKDPVSVLGSTLRRRTLDSKTLRGKALFRYEEKRFALLEG